MVIVPQYPFTLQDPSDVPIAECWYARPQLFFNCNVRPKDGRPPSRANYNHGPADIRLELVFFSTFESLDFAQWSELECKNFMSDNEPSPRPSSLWLPASTCWGEPSSFPCFWTGTQHLLSPTSTVSTIPHGSTDSSKGAGRKGSNVYKMNLWLWQLGRGKPRLLGAFGSRHRGPSN